MDREKRLKKLRQLTSKWGIYQHGKLGGIDRAFGYALDDQARAFIVAKDFGAEDLAKIYFDFVVNSLGESGEVYQFFYDKGEIIEPDKSVLASEDAWGMVLWSMMGSGDKDQKMGEMIKIILKRDWKYPRSMAYALLGLAKSDKYGELEYKLTEKLMGFYKKQEEWKWFSEELTYGNAIIPWALWRQGRKNGGCGVLEVAKESTDFLVKVCEIDGVPAPIGCKGWYKKGGEKAVFDQQPVDAAYMICCLEEAYLTTGGEFYRDWAKSWWGWFWGNNVKKISLVDTEGGCFDAITEEGVNLNQGAESNICFLMAYLAAERMGLNGDR